MNQALFDRKTIVVFQVKTGKEDDLACNGLSASGFFFMYAILDLAP